MKNMNLGMLAGLCLSVAAQNDVGTGGALDADAFGADMDNIWPERKCGGGGGRPSPFLDAVRGLQPGQVHREPIVMEAEDGGDVKKAAARITAKIYRKAPLAKGATGKSKTYALGWKPEAAIVLEGQKIGNYTAKQNEVWVRRKNVSAAPAAAPTATPAQG